MTDTDKEKKEGNLEDGKTGFSFTATNVMVFLAIAIVTVFGVRYGWDIVSSKEKGDNNAGIVVMDIDGIIESKKNEFVAKYKDKKDLSKEEVEWMEKETTDFSQNLRSFIDKESQDKVILNRNVVISQNVVDITEKAREYLKIDKK